MMKKVFHSLIIVVMATFLTVGVFAQEMNNDAGKRYNEGNKLLKEGKYSDAVVKYDSALTFQKDYRIFYQKGLALKKQGQFQQALDAFEQSVNQKTDFAAGYNALGGVYYALGKYDSAVVHFEKVLTFVKNDDVKQKIQENMAYAYAKLGVGADEAGEPQKAIEYLEKAVNNSNYDAAYLTLAKAYTEVGDNDKAISAGEKALKYKSTISSGGPYYYMGVAYKNKGDMTKAKEMFNKAKSDATYKKLSEYELKVME
jgi:tetratricopeptide (TPR) repeat protein